MASVEKIKQIINAMESGVQGDDVKTMDILLAGLEKEVREISPAASFVKMMRSIGRYLASKAEDAHPDTVPVLASLVRELEILVRTLPQLPEDTNEILARGIRTFKSLKARAAAPHISAKEMEELKAVILSIDWEISQITLRSFDRVITRLKEKAKASKIHYSFLRILHSIGGEVARSKADAHKDSIKLLQSVFANFERLVDAPDMAVEEKKRMIEGDIKAYNKLKRDIVRLAKPGLKPAPPDEEVPPALSHVASVPSTGEVVPLNTLAEQDEEAVKPVRVIGKSQDSPQPQRDVMGDLFSLKDSPADELLDAIHLADVHGSGQETAMAPDAMQEIEEGIKNFTPQRTDKAPIPEIESRLDAFFNQDFPETEIREVPEESYPETDVEDDPEWEEVDLIDADLVPDPSLPGEELPDDAIVPIEDENEQDAAILERLELSLGTPAKLAGNDVFTKVLEDLFQLKQLWLEDSKKSSLLTLMAGLTQYIHDQETTDTVDAEETIIEISDHEEPDHQVIAPLETEPREFSSEEEEPEPETEEPEEDDQALEDHEYGEDGPDGDDREDDDRQEPESEDGSTEPEGSSQGGIFAKITSMFRN